MLKKLITISLALVSIFIFHPIYAEDNSQEISNEDNSRVVVCQESTWYTSSSSNTSISIASVATAHNSTNTTQEMLFTGRRTIKFTGNVGGQAERNVIMGKVGLYAEVGYGVDKTIEVTAKTYVPPHTTYYCDFGSNIVVTTGYINKRDVSCNVSKNSASLQYTYGPYVGWRN